MEETIDSLLGGTVDSVLDAPTEAEGVDHWKPLYAGLDQPAPDPKQNEALDYLGRKFGQDKEARAQAINLSYVGSKMPEWTPDMLQRNWPTVRDSFAKEQGFTQGEPITDSGLYTKISTHLDEEEEKKAVLSRVAQYSRGSDDLLAMHSAKLDHLTFWEEVNTGLLKLPEAPPLADLPALGLNNPAIMGGIYNSVIKPFTEGATSPVGLATFGLGAEAQAGNVIAKKMLAGISGLFSGLMGYAAVEKTPEMVKVLKDPNASTQEKTQAVGGVVGDTLMALLAATHAVSELHPAPKKLAAELEGKTPEQAATVLREEANATPEPELAETLNHAAEKFDEIPSPRNDLMGEGAPERGLETPKTEEAAPKTQPEGETPVNAKETIPVAEIQKQYSVKNAAVEKDLKAMGEEPPTKAEVRSDEVAMAKAKETLEADPMAGRKLVEELAGDEKPRAVSHDEVTLLSHEYVRVNLERERLQTEYDTALKEGKPVDGILDRIEQAREDIKDTADVLKEVGTEQGRAFRGRQLFLKEDYSLGTMERRISEARGGEKLTPEQAEEVKGLHEKLSASEKKYEEYKSRMSELLMSEEETVRKAGRGKPPSKLMARLSEQAAAARERIKTRLTEGRVSSGIDPALLADYAIVGAEHIAKGVRKFGQWSEAMAKEFGESVLPHLRAIYDKAAKHDANAEHAKFLEREKSKLETSIKTIEQKIKDEDLSSPGEEANRPAVRELEVLRQKKDELASELTRMREEASKIKGLEESIKEKSDKIKSGDLSVDGDKQNRPATDSIEKLKQERDKLNKDLAEARKKANAPTDEEVLAERLEALQEQIADKETKLKTGDLSTEPAKMNRPLSKELEEARQRIEELNQEIATARKGPAKDPEAIRLESFKERTAKTTAELKRRIEESDFSPKAKREALKLDEEARHAQAERDHLRAQFEAMKDKAEYESKSWGGKRVRNAVDLYDALRTIKATGELSFILRQGGPVAASNPILSARAIPDTLRALTSDPITANAINLQVLNHPDAVLARKAKLHLMDENSSLNHKEEAFASRLVGKMPGVGRIDRATTVYLNRIRFDLWQELRKGTDDTPEAQAAVAKFVNEATGRGSLGGLEPSAVTMGRILFSPRFTFSRFQTLVGHSLWGAPVDAKVVLAKQYAKTLVGLGAYYTAMALFLNSFRDDNDPKVEIGIEETSSDFGKIKIGNTRLDPLSGIQQPFVFAARALEGKTTDQNGKEIDFRNDPKARTNGWEIAGRFAASKLHPTAATIGNTLFGKDIIGKPVERPKDLEGLFRALAPMTYPDILDAFRAQDVPEATGLSLLALAGQGLNTYDPKAHKKNAKVVTRPE